MNSKIMFFFKNFSYTLISNLISLVVSTLVVLVIPKLIGVEEYGYWQLYLFYSAYVGFLHFGWNDGIYLRYGGERYKDLDKGKFFSQFYMMVIFQLALALIGFLVSDNFIDDTNRIFIYKMIAINLVLFNVRSMLLFILQATNRIKEYARITIFDRVIYIGFILLFLLVGVREFNLLVIADLFGKVISLIVAIVSCKEIIFMKVNVFYFDVRETFLNINAGIKLMFANISSMLIIGVIRFGIERTWDVETFGKISLTLSISNLMMIFINSIGIIIYPALRRTENGKLVKIYCVLRDVLMVLSFGILILYYPLKQILTAWLPNYSDSLIYMSILFPMLIYEGKTALLLNTYFKTLRKEKLMLQVNLTSLVASILLTLLATELFGNLNFTVTLILVILAFRAIFAEYMLSKIINISIKRDVTMELLMTIVFVTLGWFLNSWLSTIIYIIAYIFFIVIKLEDIRDSISVFKSLLRNEM